MQFKSNSKHKPRRLTRFGCIMRLWRLISRRRPQPINVTLGRYLDGTAADLCVEADGSVVLPEQQLSRHVVMVGKDPRGKNLATLLFFNEIARQDRRAQLFVFDGDRDPEMATQIEQTMEKRGRRRLSFPEQPFDMWAGSDWRLIWSRLIAVIPPVRMAPAAFYADAMALILQRACRLGKKPPRSWDQLIERLDHVQGEVPSGFESREGEWRALVEGAKMRCRAFAGPMRTTLEGRRSFRGLKSAYFGLDMLSDAGRTTMRVLFSQLRGYVEYEKDPSRRCVVIVRIPAGLAAEVALAELLEVARGHNAIVVLMFETPLEAGGSTQIRRLAENLGTVLVHSSSVPHDVEQLIGPWELSDACSRSHFQPASSAMQARPRVTKQDLLQLSGRRWVVLGGKGETVIEAPAPHS